MKKLLLVLAGTLVACAVFAAGKTGTFSATDDKPDQTGYTGKLSLTFDNGKITAVDFDEFSKEGKSKKGNAGYAKMMKAKVKVSPPEAYKKLSDQLLATQDPAKVDVVSGATEMTKRFKELATEIISAK